jgi:hypothetical protein
MSTEVLAPPAKVHLCIESGKKTRITWPALAAALAFATSFLQVFILPDSPVAPWGDPVLFLENAKRILGGQLPYRDYLQFTTPGTELFYAALMRIGHPRAWISNLTMAVLAAITALIITSIAARLFSGASSLVPTLLFIGFVLPNSLYATHHWFSTVAVLAAAWVLLEEPTTPRVIIAGALCGTAGFFTQSTMIAGAIALVFFLLMQNRGVGDWRRFRTHCATLMLSAGTVFIAADLYFIRAAGIARFVFSTIVFPFRYYPSEPYNTWRIYGSAFTSHAGLARLAGIVFVHATVPFAYVAWFLYRRKHPILDQTCRRTELLLVTTGIGMLASIVGAPSLLRLSAASAPAVILLATILHESGTGRHFLRLMTAASACLTVIVPCTVQTHWHALLVTPTGRIAFFDGNRYDEFRWTLQRTIPGQPFFGNPALSFALNLRNPTPVNLSTTSDFTRPSEVEQIVRGLDESKAPLLVLSPAEYVPEPGTGRSNHMEPFRIYLDSHYQLSRRFASGDEAWTRRKDHDSRDLNLHQQLQPH